LRYYYFLETDLDGIPVVVTRTGGTSEVGYEIYLRDGSRGDELWERIMEAGRPFNIRPTGPSDIRRIEGGSGQRCGVLGPGSASQSARGRREAALGGGRDRRRPD
jgi:hypothetical protein